MTVELTVREGPGDHLPRFEAVPNETAELAMLAQRITAALQSGRVHLISAAERAAEIGAVLIRAQELVPRGQWQKWVEENTDLAVPTAREYMRIARSDTAASVRTIRAFRALGASQKELPDRPRSAPKGTPRAAATVERLADQLLRTVQRMAVELDSEVAEAWADWLDECLEEIGEVFGSAGQALRERVS